MVDLTGRLLWMTDYSKKQWRRLFWRIRASVKKALKSNGGRVRLLRVGARGGGGAAGLKFQYDPSSYALNFDDGWYSKGGEVEQEKQSNPPDGFRVVKLVRHQQMIPPVSDTSDANNNNNAVTWVYVFWVKI